MRDRLRRPVELAAGVVLGFATLVIWMYYRVPANFEQARERMERSR